MICKIFAYYLILDFSMSIIWIICVHIVCRCAALVFIFNFFLLQIFDSNDYSFIAMIPSPYKQALTGGDFVAANRAIIWDKVSYLLEQVLVVLGSVLLSATISQQLWSLYSYCEWLMLFGMSST